MIKYQLVCEKDHEFAGWFQSSGAFDAQVKRNLLDCPTCGSTDVRKAIMAPNVATRDVDVTPMRAARAPGPGADPRAVAVHAEMVKAMRELRRKVEENAEYVGPRFAEEARRIHYKETEEKGIYGEATLADAKALAEEGIEFMPLPVLPEDHN
jgi:hypothetical protein